MTEAEVSQLLWALIRPDASEPAQPIIEQLLRSPSAAAPQVSDRIVFFSDLHYPARTTPNGQFNVRGVSHLVDLARRLKCNDRETIKALGEIARYQQQYPIGSAEVEAAVKCKKALDELIRPGPVGPIQSKRANRITCEICHQPHAAKEWPQNGDSVPFYYQRERGVYDVEVKCPKFNMKWYVVWDDYPGLIGPLSSSGTANPQPVLAPPKIGKYKVEETQPKLEASTAGGDGERMRSRSDAAPRADGSRAATIRGNTTAQSRHLPEPAPILLLRRKQPFSGWLEFAALVVCLALPYFVIGVLNVSSSFLQRELASRIVSALPIGIGLWMLLLCVALALCRKKQRQRSIATNILGIFSGMLICLWLFAPVACGVALIRYRPLISAESAHSAEKSTASDADSGKSHNEPVGLRETKRLGFAEAVQSTFEDPAAFASVLSAYVDGSDAAPQQKKDFRFVVDQLVPGLDEIDSLNQGVHRLGQDLTQLEPEQAERILHHLASWELVGGSDTFGRVIHRRLDAVEAIASRITETGERAEERYRRTILTPLMRIRGYLYLRSGERFAVTDYKAVGETIQFTYLVDGAATSQSKISRDHLDRADASPKAWSEFASYLAKQLDQIYERGWDSTFYLLVRAIANSNSLPSSLKTHLLYETLVAGCSGSSFLRSGFSKHLQMLQAAKTSVLSGKWQDPQAADIDDIEAKCRAVLQLLPALADGAQAASKAWREVSAPTYLGRFDWIGCLVRVDGVWTCVLDADPPVRDGTLVALCKGETRFAMTAVGSVARGVATPPADGSDFLEGSPLLVHVADPTSDDAN